MKRRNIGMCFFLLSTFLTTGCAKQELDVKDTQGVYAENETALTFFGNKYEALSVQTMETLLHEYMTQHPEIMISYESIKGTGYYDALIKRSESGYLDDIFMVDQASANRLRKQGVLADLSDLSTIDNFNDLAKSQMLAQGDVTYLPTSISAFGLYCNEDLLKKHHQKIPRNQKEFEEVCDYFVDKGITPLIVNNDISLKTLVLGKGMYEVYQRKDAEDIIQAFNTGERSLAEQLRPGFAYVENMIKKHYIDTKEALKTKKTDDDLTLFAQGDRPFMISGAWAALRLQDKNPKLTFSIQPYPILEEGSVMVVNVDTRIAVNAKGPHVKEAKAFVEYLTQKDTMRAFAQSITSFIPCEEDQQLKDDILKPMEPYMENGRIVIGSDDNLNYPIWNLTHKSIVKMLQGKNTDETVKTLERKLKQSREEDAYEK